MSRETVKFGDSVRLILEIVRYLNDLCIVFFYSHVKQDKLHKKLTYGSDNINNELIHICLVILVQSLNDILNKVMQDGYSTEMKTDEVIEFV